MSSLSILVPAYNEARSIGNVVRSVLSSKAGIAERELIVVDDGSSDRTADVARRAADGDGRFRLISHARNRGKGAAIHTALTVARGTFCIIQDGDLEYDVRDYARLMFPLQRGAHAVYGSRFVETARPRGMKLTHLAANRLLTLTANALYGLGISDEATCYKAFRTETLRSLQLSETDFAFCPEVTAKLGLMGIDIVEVPVSYCARSRSDGKKIRWRDGVKAMVTLLKYRLGAARSTPPMLAADRVHALR